MPLFKIKKAENGEKLGIWQMTESVDELLKMKSFSKKDMVVLNTFSYENRKKEWLTSRILAEKLSGKNTKIAYDKHNKPILKGSKNHISISHSNSLLAVIIDTKETGIDIELVKPAVIRIKQKFMNEDELSRLEKTNLKEKLTLCWCVKESLYKYYGKKKLIFKKHLIVEPFSYNKKGAIAALLDHGSMKKRFELNYEKIGVQKQNFILAYIVKEV